MVYSSWEFSLSKHSNVCSYLQRTSTILSRVGLMWSNSHLFRACRIPSSRVPIQPDCYSWVRVLHTYKEWSENSCKSHQGASVGSTGVFSWDHEIYEIFYLLGTFYLRAKSSPIFCITSSWDSFTFLPAFKAYLGGKKKTYIHTHICALSNRTISKFWHGIIVIQCQWHDLDD